MIGKQLIVVFDESTSQKNNNSKYELGMSLCFWVAYVYDPDTDKHPTNKVIARDRRHEIAILMKSINAKPVRSGAIYNDTDTPIKICLDGVARALEACEYLVDKHDIKEIVLVGDCEPAIKLINGDSNRKAISITSLCNKIDNSIKNYKEKNVSVSAKYVAENNFSLFKDIDGIAKNFRNVIDKTFNQ
jgi:hypothetical protein